ncbi:hypothetical protein Q1695_006054 [Nippostrongylus brasiliensis]|nr:hypothetical protein Q1695_006054 [Nippostrongylus brasiliensis]
MGGSYSTPVLSKESMAIKEEVAKYPVVMYTKERCPYCMYAKKQLNDDEIFYVEKAIQNFSEPGTTDASIQGLVNLTQCTTVPQIFICGKFIGGYNELSAARANLPKLIAECSSDGKTYDRTTKNSSLSKI